MTRRSFILIGALLASSVFAADSAPVPPAPLSPGALQKLNRKLAAELNDSLAEAEYLFRPDENGKRPEFSVGYLCPNCNSMHYGSGDELLADERPFRVPAYAIAPNVFISSDISIRPEWLDSLTITFKGKRYPAKLTAYYPEQKSVRLETQTAVEGIVPLKFNPATEGARFAFFRVEEDGIAVAGVRPWTEAIVVRELGSGREYVPTAANVLIVNDKGEVAALSMKDKMLPGSGITPPPEEWESTPAEAFEKKLLDFTAMLEKNLYPVTVRMRQPRQLTGPAARYRNSEENRSEAEGIAVKLRDGKVLVNLALSPAETARTQKIVLKNGEKEIAARFEGSLRHFGAFTVVPEEDLPGDGIVLYDGDPAQSSGLPVYNVIAGNFGGKLDLKLRPGTVDEFETGFRGMPVPGSAMRNKGYLFTPEGVLLALPMTRRSINEERYNLDRQVASPMALSLLKDYDPNNTPRQGEAEVAWLGVEYQTLDEELARANHVSEYTRNGQEGLMVSFVYPGSPADKLGIQSGDILLAVTPAGSTKQERFTGYQYRRDFMERFPWEYYDQVPPQYFDEIPPPWGSTLSGLNEMLGRIGIGGKAKLTYLSEGKMTEKEFVITAAPESFDTIEKSADSALGASLCDLTYEIRSYFQLKPEEGGVMVARIKAGERAAVAGIKPYEILVSVDGAPVKDLAEFKELTDGKKEYKLGVRRLAVTRIVHISIK